MTTTKGRKGPGKMRLRRKPDGHLLHRGACMAGQDNTRVVWVTQAEYDAAWAESIALRSGKGRSSPDADALCRCAAHGFREDA